MIHRKDSYGIITPSDVPMPAATSSVGSESDNRERDAASFFPERVSQVFSDPAPNSGKVTLRPKSVARAEEAASGVALLKPHRWEAFENYLRLNKSDIQENCSQCASMEA